MHMHQGKKVIYLFALLLTLQFSLSSFCMEPDSTNIGNTGGGGDGSWQTAIVATGITLGMYLGDKAITIISNAYAASLSKKMAEKTELETLNERHARTERNLLFGQELESRGDPRGAQMIKRAILEREMVECEEVLLQIKEQKKNISLKDTGSHHLLYKLHALEQDIKLEHLNKMTQLTKMMSENSSESSREQSTVDGLRARAQETTA